MKIKFVNQPRKEGGKFGNLAMDNGEKYFVAVANLGRFSAGMDIQPPFENQKWGQDVVKVIPASYDPAANGNAPAASAAPPRAMPNGQTKDAAMFVMGVTGRAMQSGKYDITDIKAIALAAVEAWEQVKGRI